MALRDLDLGFQYSLQFLRRHHQKFHFKNLVDTKVRECAQPPRRLGLGSLKFEVFLMKEKLC